MVALLPGQPVGEAGGSLVGLLEVNHPDARSLRVVDEQQRAADQLVGGEEGRLETENADSFQSCEVKVLEMRATRRATNSSPHSSLVGAEEGGQGLRDVFAGAGGLVVPGGEARDGGALDPEAQGGGGGGGVPPGQVPGRAGGQAVTCGQSHRCFDTARSCCSSGVGACQGDVTRCQHHWWLSYCGVLGHHLQEKILAGLRDTSLKSWKLLEI